MNHKKLLDFYKGIGVAIQKSNLKADNVGDSCVAHVIEEYNKWGKNLK